MVWVEHEERVFNLSNVETITHGGVNVYLDCVSSVRRTITFNTEAEASYFHGELIRLTQARSTRKRNG
jgi:hypothetical protein